MIDAIKATLSTPVTEPKFTAAQIEENCPVALRNLGKQIAVQYEKAQKYEDKADQNYTTVAQLLATAHGACDEGGFNAFRNKFFPNLGKSRLYELLAIGNDKKSIEEVRAGNRARVAKHRANKAATSASVTVTENLEPEALGAPTEADTVETTSIASEQAPEPTKPRSSVSPGDEVTPKFTTLVLELDRRIYKRQPAQFSATAASVEVLARLGSFLTDTANFKKSEAVKPARITALLDNGEVSAAEQSAEDIKTERPAPAEDLRP
jgi:hypothetical protein